MTFYLFGCGELDLSVVIFGDTHQIVENAELVIRRDAGVKYKIIWKR